MSKIYPYAGFWRRAIALFIDSLIISIILVILYSAILGTQLFKLAAQNPQNPDPKIFLSMFASMFLFQVLGFVFFWLYFALQESGKAQATLGKRAMGIKVVGADGGRISFWRATGREFGKIVSNMTLYFGYYMAGFTKKRQALHDVMADTYVVRDSFQAGEEKPELPFSVGGLIASILAAVLPVVCFFLLMVIGVIAAAAGAEDKDFLSTPNVAAEETMANDEDWDEEEWENTQIQGKAIAAQAKMIIYSMKKPEKPFPFTSHNITYTETQDGYQAEFSDKNGQVFVLELRKDADDACCVKGDCKRIATNPCN